MQSNESNRDRLIPQSEVSKQITFLRLSFGLVQGLILYWLYHASETGLWAASHNSLYVALLLIAGLIPLLLISSLGHLSKSALIRWIVVATIIVAGVGFYDFWRASGPHDILGKLVSQQKASFPTLLVVLFTSAGLFIAQCLVLAANQDQRRIANYPTYFETSWKLLIQIKFSVLFVLVLWLVLWIGAGLFKLVGLDFLFNWIEQSWFSIPVTVFSFSCAMHITDVRPGIVRGIRSLLLVLLSWVLPLTTLLIGAFIICLPFTGLQALWATGHATVLLLIAVAALVTLINAAFQNGEVSKEINGLIRLSARIAAILLLPLTGLATYALFLRVNDYGWTSDRLIAAACLLVASTHALGYLWAACQRKSWLKPISNVNIYASFLILALLLALFSPLADPARLSVANQEHRLVTGKIKAAAFDYNYLRFEGGRYGKAALERLQAQPSGPEASVIRTLAKQALDRTSRWDDGDIDTSSAINLKQNIVIWPKQAVLPESFWRQNWGLQRNWQLPGCLSKAGSRCSAHLIDVTQDGTNEILLIGDDSNTGSAVLKLNEQGQWYLFSTINSALSDCKELRRAIESGRLGTTRKQVDDLLIGKQRIVLETEAQADLSTCNDPKP